MVRQPRVVFPTARHQGCFSSCFDRSPLVASNFNRPARAPCSVDDSTASPPQPVHVVRPAASAPPDRGRAVLSTSSSLSGQCEMQRGARTWARPPAHSANIHPEAASEVFFKSLTHSFSTDPLSISNRLNRITWVFHIGWSTTTLALMEAF